MGDASADLPRVALTVDHRHELGRRETVLAERRFLAEIITFSGRRSDSLGVAPVGWTHALLRVCFSLTRSSLARVPLDKRSCLVLSLGSLPARTANESISGELGPMAGYRARPAAPRIAVSAERGSARRPWYAQGSRSIADLGAHQPEVRLMAASMSFATPGEICGLRALVDYAAEKWRAVPAPR